ncbi:pyruvate, water dikinase regulatory protein [Candidatus Acidulodesulfobacterium sp. H_13]|uniref:pyruvate, water dikinase regulatory protein n=1 Tax=Candidatus Acidulodesulfobacterium sp. H_13 TaxID=3395470 RepID=UPI003AF66C7A
MNKNDDKGKEFYVFVVSDSTGETAEKVARAALSQFSIPDIHLKRYLLIDSELKLREMIMNAADKGALVVFTLVKDGLRNIMLQESAERGIVSIDIIGPVLNSISRILDLSPERKPGLIHRVNDEYFKRIDALEYAVKHDDGQRVDEISESDALILGVSRTSKTPLCLFLAQRGFKAANIPIIDSQAINDAVYNIPKEKIFGLVADSARISNLRKERLKRMRLPFSKDYASEESIEKELVHSKKIYAKLNAYVVDITEKSIEEVAADIISRINNR